MDALNRVADPGSPDGSRVRKFLWEASDETTTRSDFIPLATVFHALSTTPDLSALVTLVAELFPEQTAGGLLKRLLLGRRASEAWLADHEEQDILFALATTSNYQSFDADALSVRDRGAELCIAKPDAATWLVGALFRASLNALGEEILAGLISAMEPETARRVTSQQLQFLPALFRAKPALAGSSQLWVAGADRKRELFEACRISQESGSGNCRQHRQRGVGQRIGRLHHACPRPLGQGCRFSDTRLD